MSHEYDIAMLGPSGVGKTSLLSAIHTEFAQGIPGTNLHVRSSRRSGRYLQDRRAELERLCRSAFVTEPGIRGTATARSIELVLAQLDSAEGEAELTMRFTDHPGGWLFSESAPTEAAHAELRARFERAGVLVLVVDTPALMWRDGFFHHDVNRPLQVCDELREWLAARDRGTGRQLVLVAPVKCEAWINPRDPGTGLAELQHAVEVGYADVLDVLRRSGDVPARLTPVHTVGGLIHDGYRRSPDGTLQSRFRGDQARPRYTPRWGGEVMRQLLVAAIDRRVEQRNLWESLQRVFGVGRAVEQAAEELRTGSFGPSASLIEVG